MSETKIDNYTDYDGLFSRSPLVIDAHRSTSGDWVTVHAVEPAWIRDSKGGLLILEKTEINKLARDENGNIKDFE